jgi:uncharacterized protein (TIGR01777 family)
MATRSVIAGGSGLLGRAITARLLAAGHRVVVLGRSGAARTASSEARIEHVTWRPDGSVGEWARALEGAEVVVNLSGAGIADARWTASRKAILESSRMLSTTSLVKAIEACEAKPRVFVQGSAVGYYGASLDSRPRDESAPPGTDFLGDLSQRWEAAAAPIEQLGCRLVIARTGVVLDRAGGALPKMALPFRLFVGGPVGSGRQALSWIHRDDWTRLVCWLIERPEAKGAFNVCAPAPVTNREFSRALGRALHRPNWAPVPAFVLRTIFGEMADAMLLSGQWVIPARALNLGFEFGYPTIDSALRELW